MKIGITTFGCDNGKSGIGRYVLHLLEEFGRLNSKVRFEVLVHPTEKETFATNAPNMETLVVPDAGEGALSNVFWHSRKLPGLCRERGYDALFLPAANRRVPFHCPCPTLGTVHDFSSLHVQGKYDAAHLFYIRHVLPALVRRLTHVVTVSESSKRDIVQYAKVPAEKVSVTPLAADAETYCPRPKEEAQCRMAARHGLRTPYLLYISRSNIPVRTTSG